MADGLPPAVKRRRLSTSGRTESTPPASDPRDELQRRPPIQHSVSHVEHLPTADFALLHVLDGQYIKRHSVDPWNSSGGFCDVFTGQHPSFGKVAMKRPRLTEDGCVEKQVESFISEAEVWGRLRHPNVLRFLGIILSDSRVWLVSVFAKNGSLPEYIRKNQDVDRPHLVFQLANGLAYLHSENVIHGDLKASNLLVSAGGELLIGDFGLSKLMDERMKIASSKERAGSVLWQAPELLNSENPTKTFASDVYAYGITISEMLRGELPFNECSSLVAAVQAIISNKRPPTTPRESPRGQSYAILWDVAEVCWSPDPCKRPTMLEVFRRFSLQPTLLRDAAITAIGTSVYRPSSGAATRASIEDTSIISPPSSQAATIDSATEARLLTLLGDADYGDVGYMKEDGLCLDGTRVEILQRLDGWANSNCSSRVTLVKGQAGRGKSTVARSVLSRFREHWGNRASSAIFHFRRGNEATNNRPLLALARQLGRNGDTRIRQAILRAVQTHEDVAQLRFEEQFEILLAQSLEGVQLGSPHVLIVIDALDECSDRRLIFTLLRLIGKYSPSLPSTVKFLLSSRPEDRIISPFNAMCGGSHEDLDGVDLGLIDHDVRSYFLVHLDQIQMDYGLDEAWVSSSDIRELVSLSQGLFQWAHAAMEYVRERPRLHLRQLVQTSNVVLGLPALYRQILSTAFPQHTGARNGTLPALVQHVIGSLVIADRPMSPAVLEYLWCNAGGPTSEDPGAEIREGVLGRLGSIFNIPSSPDGPIHFMHTSVRDFFTDKDQCTDARFLIDSATHHARLSVICFDRMKRDLKHDVCGINDSSKTNLEALNLVEQRLPSGLRYCCLSWPTHLAGVKHREKNTDCQDLHHRLNEFCVKNLLHWVELLGLAGATSDLHGLICQAKDWIEGAQQAHCQENPQTARLIEDIDNFCRRFSHVISFSAQHVTLSYILHFPEETALRNAYAPTTRTREYRVIRGPLQLDSSCLRVIPTQWSIQCVAFSPDGKTLASVSDNGTIWFWDVNSGALKGDVLVGHSHQFESVAFSPDGKTLATGSADNTVQFWDINSGAPKGDPLVGHSDRVRSVTFSPDGKTLASGSHDKTIRFWDVDSGAPKGDPLVGHSDWVTSVTFSPDGKTLASGSFDNTVQFWDINSGAPKGDRLVGHNDWVGGATFSPDGKTLASGSDDKTIQFWDVDSRAPKGDPLVGYSDWVTSVTFSPDGKTLASGSSDNTIRFWDANSGAPRGDPLVGHSDCVRSVAFSPDGKTLASGSDDNTIRFWDVDYGASKGEPLVGHSQWVTSVAFSPDGKTLASGSGDNTIRFWDVDYGASKGEPLVGHSHWVTSVAFSPDGKTLASGSVDETIRFWDVDSGASKGEPLSGHSDWVTSFTFSPDGKTLISQTRSEKLCWNLETRERVESTGNTEGSIASSEGSDRSRLNHPVMQFNHLSDPSEAGWVHLQGRRCFWLPEEFYVNPDGYRAGASLFNNFLVIHHCNIYILDVSSFLHGVTHHDI